jgi:hypothetical protein
MPKTNRHDYIFIRLSDLLGSQFSRLLKQNRDTFIRPVHWTEIQTICFQSTVESWREYINWLDQEVSILVSSICVLFVERNAAAHYRVV